MNALADAVLGGDRLSLARLITGIENQQSEAFTSLDQLFPYTGKAHLIGVTGAPGSGKSSLVNQIARCYRHPEGTNPARRVAVVAVDPTSPFTGGALLGDRVRMRDLSGDSGVFIRSMASRGALGGLASATFQVVQILDAAGFESIIIETVGVGQSEIDIARLAHTVIVVEAPGMGDDVQAGKAGILEIADILVVNKADQDGAVHTLRVLNQMLDMAYTTELNNQGTHHPRKTGQAGAEQLQSSSNWRPPVLKTIAPQGEGINMLMDSLTRHWDFLELSGELKIRDAKRLRNEFDNLLKEGIMTHWRSQMPDGNYHAVLSGLMERRYSPREAVNKLVSIGSFLLLT